MISKKQLEEIEEFTDKVYPIYCHFEWKWVGEEVTWSDIRNQIIDFIERIQDDKDLTSTSSGRLFAERIQDVDYEEIRYGLKIENIL